MNFEVDVNGRTRSVSVEHTKAGHYRVVVDGRPYDVDAERSGPYELSLLLGGSSGASRAVSIAPSGRRGEWLAGLEGRSVPVALNSRQTGRASGGEGGVHGEVTITAPMPGRIVRVLVSTGDAVEPRQGAVVVEAMKMENELRSPKAGRVKDVLVTPGQSVDAGRPLIVIE